MTIAAKKIYDSYMPILPYKEGVVSSSKKVIPLKKTDVDVSVDGFLAEVSTKMEFSNETSSSMEATMTFPVPVDSVVFGVEVFIGSRHLVAQAQGKEEARDTYESGIERGKTSILHEEKMRGIHMLSVGHIPPNESVSVVYKWVKPVTVIDGVGYLRIPTTVAEIYGKSPLMPSDDLVVDEEIVHKADIKVVVSEGVAVIGETEKDVASDFPMNNGIDILVTGMTSKSLIGHMRPSSQVGLTISECEAGTESLKLGVLFDISGSTGDSVTSGGKRLGERTWDIMYRSLSEVLTGNLQESDLVKLWEFDNGSNYLGKANGDNSVKLLKSIHGPRNGTDIDASLQPLLVDEEINDILLITDGRSYALDVQNIAKTGKRVSVILVGDDALEANVGHLAALTDGQIIVVSKMDATKAAQSMIGFLRRRVDYRKASKTKKHFERVVGGSKIVFDISSSKDEDVGSTNAAGAFSAFSLMRTMSDKAAMKLAVDNGICSHLTSLVLVDEEGGTQDGIPNQHKVPLSSPLGSSGGLVAMAACSPMNVRSFGITGHSAMSLVRTRSSAKKSLFSSGDLGLVGSSFESFSDPLYELTDDSLLVGGLPDFGSRSSDPDLFGSGSSINWELEANRLSNEDLSGISSFEAEMLKALAKSPAVLELSVKYSKTALSIAIGLVAKKFEKKNRNAKRLASKMLTGISDVDLKTVLLD